MPIQTTKLRCYLQPQLSNRSCRTKCERTQQKNIKLIPIIAQLKHLRRSLKFIQTEFGMRSLWKMVSRRKSTICSELTTLDQRTD